MNRFELDWGPVVVGGVGGSGTRVAARLLLELGFHLGDDLNTALDNLWFTLLLMRPRWFAAAPDEIAGEVDDALRVLGRGLRGEELSAEDVALVEAAAEETHRRGYTLRPEGAGAGDWNATPGGSWAGERLQSLLAAGRRASGRAAAPAERSEDRPGASGRPAGWGWKEPNSHVFLPELGRAFDRMRFVLVIRHGLDMAFSDNRAQLVNWGARFGVEAPGDGGRDPRRSLDFWVVANERAIDYGKARLPGRFLVLNYDRLCLSPDSEVRRLCRFVEREPPPELLRRLIRIPQPPASMGRYRQHDLGQFDTAQIDAVRRLGFDA